MDITAVATDSGISILKGNFKDTVKDFIIIGSESNDNKALDNIVNDKNSDYAKIQDHIIFKDNIKSAYYDTKGILTFELVLPYEGDFKKYIYAVGLISTDNVLVSISKTPKFYKMEGLGGTFTYKVAINSTPADIVYNNTDILFATDDEAIKGDVRLKAIDPYQLRKATVANADTLNGKHFNELDSFPIGTIFPSLVPPDNFKGYKYVMLTGGWQKYNEGLIIAEDIRQEAHTSNTKDLNYGTTLHCIGTLGKIGSPMDGWKIRLINSEKRYIRAGNEGVYDDTIRNIEGVTGGVTGGNRSTPTGPFSYLSSVSHIGWHGDNYPNQISFNASLVVPTGNENRPRTIEFVYYMRIL